MGIPEPAECIRDTVKRPRVSVVMPCLNEALTLAACIAEARAGLAAAGVSGEVVIADNGSTDGSVEIATKHGANVVLTAERGYGNALMAGFETAQGDFIIMGDCDGSYDFTHIPRFLECLTNGSDIVIGNRFLGGIDPQAMPWLHRYIGNPLLSWLGRILFGSPIGDFHCGLRGMQRKAYRHLGMCCPGMEFAGEMVIKATLRGLQVAEVPTRLRRDGRDRPPHLRTWRDGWRNLRFMLLLSPNWLFLLPGSIVFALGLVLFSLVWMRGPFEVMGATISVNTMIASGLLSAAGFQVMLFGAAARSIAIALGLSRTYSGPASTFPLERGVLVGLMLAAVGLGALAWAALSWAQNGFGNIPLATTIESVIPSTLAILFGTEITFGSFFLSLPSVMGRPQPRSGVGIGTALGPSQGTSVC